MPEECLLRGFGPDIPKLAGAVDGAGDVGVVVRAQAYADDVTSVGREIRGLFVRF